MSISHTYLPPWSLQSGPYSVISGLFLPFQTISCEYGIGGRYALLMLPPCLTAPLGVDISRAAPFFGFPDATHLFFPLDSFDLSLWFSPSYCFLEPILECQCWEGLTGAWSLLTWVVFLGCFICKLASVWVMDILTSVMLPNFQNHAFNRSAFQLNMSSHVNFISQQLPFLYAWLSSRVTEVRNLESSVSSSSSRLLLSRCDRHVSLSFGVCNLVHAALISLNYCDG